MEYYKHNDSILTGPWHYNKKCEEMSKKLRSFNMREVEVNPRVNHK